MFIIKMDTLDTNGSVGEGNTKPLPPKRIVASKYWCFTWNNYCDGAMDILETRFKKLDILYICGYEKGESGTPHIQGYLESPKKIRPVEFLKLDCKIHWEKRKGSKSQNLDYCKKEGNFTTNFPDGDFGPEKIKTVLPENFYPWQSEIVDLAGSEPDDRSIYWFFDKTGNIGKSSICKYLCVNKNAILLSGKAADMKYAVQQYVEKNGRGPKIILIDIPRESMNFLSYSGIEEIKNGMFFSGKYEGGMVLFNCPHIFCFSNSGPKTETMSKDRWKIKNLGLGGENSSIDELDFINDSEDDLAPPGGGGDTTGLPPFVLPD